MSTKGWLFCYPTSNRSLTLVNVINKLKEPDLYEVLKLKRDATEAEIKSNYKKLSLIYHPADKNGGNKTEEVKYQILFL